MDIDEKWRTIACQRTVLADVLDGASIGDLDRPSLCGRWRVRDVAAHVALTPCSPGLPRILAALVRARGDFDEVNRAMAVTHAEQLGPALAGELRAVAPRRRKPPITTIDNLLFDTIVHVQDVAVPLGAEVDVPAEGARAGADRVWRMGWPFWARRRLRAVRLVAEDVNWSVGAGPDVVGPIDALLLLLTGRTVALSRLTGAGLALVA
jgi:uncharacterized protein (TIGR03083 family)